MERSFKRLWKDKRKQVICVLGLISLVFLCLWHYINVMAYQGQEHEYMYELKTNEDAAVYTLQEQMEVLKGFEELYRLSFMACEKDKHCGTIVIPGMIATKDLIKNDNTKKYELSACTSMTPQGLCFTDDYILISAYCHNGTHNTVLYVLDKESHRFIKEIVLEGRPHAGGLAFDQRNQCVWISTGSKGKASASAITTEMIEKYNIETCRKPIEYKYEYDLHAIERNSFMACDNGHLYIGFFSDDNNGVLQKYRINEFGGLDTTFDTKYGTRKNIALPIEIKKIPDKVQGIAFYKDKVLITQSYGMQKSKLTVFNSFDTWISSNKDAVLKQITMPQMMEQVYIDGDKMYVIFESAADAYRAQPIPKVDRILKLNLRDVVRVDE